MTEAETLLEQAAEHQRQAYALRDQAKPMLGESMVNLLRTGTWKIRNDRLYPADSKTRKAAYTLAQQLGASWAHDTFDFYIKDLRVHGRTDDGTVSYSFLDIQALEQVEIINSDRWFTHHLQTLQKRERRLYEELQQLKQQQAQTRLRMNRPVGDAHQMLEDGWISTGVYPHRKFHNHKTGRTVDADNRWDFLRALHSPRTQ